MYFITAKFSKRLKLMNQQIYFFIWPGQYLAVFILIPENHKNPKVY